MENKIKSVYFRPRGHKRPFIVFRFADGHERSFTVHADLKTAQQVFAEVERKLALKILRVDDYLKEKSQLRLGEFIEAWLRFRVQQHRLQRITEATLKTDEYTFARFCKSVDPLTPLGEIDTEVIDEFCLGLLSCKTKNGTPYKPGAINVYLRHLSSAFGWAEEKSMIHKSPLRRYKKLKTDETKRYLSRETIAQVREGLTDRPPWQQDVFNLALWTGLRRAEIWSLKGRSLINIRFDGQDEPFLEVTGKGNKTRRVPLVPDALKLIERRINLLADRAAQKAELKTMHGNVSEKEVEKRIAEGYLFWEITSLSSINTAFKRLRRRLGLDYLNPHSLRHSAATYMLESGIPITVVQDALGHASINTARVYAKTTEEQLIKSFKVIGNFV